MPETHTNRLHDENPATFALTKTIPGPNGCMDWTGVVNEHGYPMIWFQDKWQLVNRIVLAHALGRRLHAGMCALHSCDRPICLSPEHLSEGTHMNNMNDRDAKGRVVHGEQHRSAKLTEEDVRTIRAHFERGAYTRRQLAQMYGVSRPTIQHIINRTQWRRVA